MKEGKKEEEEGKSHFQDEKSRNQFVIICPHKSKGFYLIRQVIHMPVMWIISRNKSLIVSMTSIAFSEVQGEIAFHTAHKWVPPLPTCLLLSEMPGFSVPSGELPGLDRSPFPPMLIHLILLSVKWSSYQKKAVATWSIQSRHGLSPDEAFPLTLNSALNQAFSF